jgi:hypothetical protein
VAGWVPLDEREWVVLEDVVFFRSVDVLFVLPELDFSFWTSRFKLSISLIAAFRSAVSSDASLLNTLANSCSAFFVLVGEAGMTVMFSTGLV